jgi:hypothetical protein
MREFEDKLPGIAQPNVRYAFKAYRTFVEQFLLRLSAGRLTDKLKHVGHLAEHFLGA